MFCWFGPGVLHATAGGFDQPRPGDWDGVLLEHLVHNEIRSHLHYRGVKGSLGYWATPGGSEVDLVWWRGQEAVPIDVKNATRLQAELAKGLEAFRARTTAKASVVYRGERELEVEGIRGLPLETFLPGCTLARSSGELRNIPHSREVTQSP